MSVHLENNLWKYSQTLGRDNYLVTNTECNLFKGDYSAFLNVMTSCQLCRSWQASQYIGVLCKATMRFLFRATRNYVFVSHCLKLWQVLIELKKKKGFAEWKLNYHHILLYAENPCQAIVHMVRWRRAYMHCVYRSAPEVASLTTQ